MTVNALGFDPPVLRIPVSAAHLQFFLVLEPLDLENDGLDAIGAAAASHTPLTA